jgi:hypothetical protein
MIYSANKNLNDFAVIFKICIILF